jgi:hypothetical protein
MPKQQPADPRAVVADYRRKNPDAYDHLCDFATCLADELASMQAEDKHLAPRDLDEMFVEPPDYECADTAAIVHFMLGYVQGTAEALGVPPAGLVLALTT